MKRRIPVTDLAAKIAPLALSVSLALGPAKAADTDIYASRPPSGDAVIPNVVFLLDNASNWLAQSQNWNSVDSWNRCKDLGEPATTQCKNIIEQIYYTDSNGSERPWSANSNYKGVALAQGRVQLRAFKLVLNALVCSGRLDALKVNVGVSMLSDAGSVLRCKRTALIHI